MTSSIPETLRKYLGWCPNARAMRNQVGVPNASPEVIIDVQPDGGSGGQGRIRRGMGLAMGSIKILIRNKRPFWFSLLAGPLMILSLAASLYLQYISGTNPLPGVGLIMNSPAVLVMKGSITWVVLSFCVSFVATFLTYCLLAGLIISVSSIISGRTMTIRDGFSRTRDHLRILASWAAIGALIGSFVSLFSVGSTADIAVILPSVVLLLVFNVLTLFVIPSIVLNSRALVPAITESVSVFRKVWGETIVCFCMFLLIVFAISLISIVPIIAIGFSAGSAGMVGFAILLNMLVMVCIVIIGVTVLGIAMLGLFSYGTTGTLSPEFRGDKTVKALA